MKGLFDSFVRASQYIAIMSLEQDAFLEAPVIMTKFFGADSSFLVTANKNFGIDTAKATGESDITAQNLYAEFKEHIDYAFSSGYFETGYKRVGAADYGVILLPLESDSKLYALLISCFKDKKEFESDALNAYLAVSTLISSTRQKQRVALRNKMILEMAGEGIFGIDKYGRHTFVNEAAATMLGFDVDELLHKNSHATWHYKRADGRGYPEAECPVFRVLKGVESQNEGDEYFLRKDGSGFEVEFVATPIKEHGEISGAVVVFRDVTKTKELERELLRINQSLEERVKVEVEARQRQELVLMQQSKMAMMGEMIGAIAHQWRQPLNSLAIIVQDVHEAFKYEELDENYVLSFKANAMNIIHRMSKTIDDFRNYFKPNKKAEKFSLQCAVEQTLDIVLPQLNNNNIKVEFEKNCSICEVYGYKNELEQAILIMLSNAKDALLDNKTDNPTIKIEITKKDGVATLAVQDNGGGVPVNVIDRIFEPYFTTKEQGKGTGIGLYIAKEIVERQMSGKISVKNESGGARFLVELLVADT